MTRFSVLLAGFLLFSPAAFCQKTETDAQTMQAVLQEIRQLRHDLQTAAIAARRAQIVIFRLHEQKMIVERLSETLENTKNELTQIQAQLGFQEMQIKRYEELMEQTDKEEQRKQLEETIDDFNGRVMALRAAEPDLQAREQDQEADVKAARGKLQQLENELDQLDQDVEQTAVQASNRRKSLEN